MAKLYHDQPVSTNNPFSPPKLVRWSVRELGSNEQSHLSLLSHDKCQQARAA
jgi:hypothetical protein